MGAWGTGVFENDEAMDWAFDLSDSGDLAMVGHTLALVEEEEEYLEVDLGEQGLAAAEVIAALLGRPAADLPEEVARWLAANGDANGKPLREQALRAVDRITAEASELHELWREAQEHYAEWLEGVKSLRGRLSD